MACLQYVCVNPCPFTPPPCPPPHPGLTPAMGHWPYISPHSDQNRNIYLIEAWKDIFQKL